MTIDCFAIPSDRIGEARVGDHEIYINIHLLDYALVNFVWMRLSDSRPGLLSESLIRNWIGVVPAPQNHRCPTRTPPGVSWCDSQEFPIFPC